MRTLLAGLAAILVVVSVAAAEQKPPRARKRGLNPPPAAKPGNVAPPSAPRKPSASSVPNYGDRGPVAFPPAPTPGSGK
ncbi:MAG TPA: hypothetical protein VNI01_04700 [Elusimicrobiota bacterium]|jgi:hypothetical protein|nr:hypothetical protein [Elusimicrobiota bacterium]